MSIFTDDKVFFPLLRLKGRLARTLVLEPGSRPGTVEVGSQERGEEMPVSQREIDQFHQFASDELKRGNADDSIDDLFDRWRLANAAECQSRADLHAVRAALRDMQNGDTGRDIEIVLRELCEKKQVNLGP
jgi:hypothetical protein